MKRLALAACAAGNAIIFIVVGSAASVLPISQSLKPNSLVVASTGIVPSVPSSESIAIPSV